MSNDYHKITFQMNSPVCFTDRPIFDGLIVYCWMTEKYGNIPVRSDLLKEQLCEFKGLPIDYHKDGYPISSIMIFDTPKCVEYEGSWKKRWAHGHDSLANFGRTQRKIHTGKGSFKSYDVSLRLYNIKTVWFYFKGDAEKVKYLIDRHLAGIGKKISQGYGFFDSYEMQDASKNTFDDTLLRPIPMKHALHKSYVDNNNSHEIRYCGYRPSYYLRENQAKCIYPSL